MKITVNGQDYESWDEVPAELRALMGNALPATSGTVSSTSFDVGGQTYRSVEELPPDVRAALGSAGLLGGPPDATTPPPLRVGDKIVVPRVDAPSVGAQAGPPTLQPGQVLLNGKVVNVDGEAKRKRWWNRG